MLNSLLQNEKGTLFVPQRARRGADRDETGARGMAREPKLERLEIPAECRVVKDWFPTRADAEAALQAIRLHINSTGRTHDSFCHTHTKPPREAVPVYLDEFVIPARYRKAKRFCPCPCCLDEFGKFGRGRIAWFPDERVIRLIGEDCFAALNPEGHEQARDLRDAEIARRRHTNFLLANLGRLPEVIEVIGRALVVARSVEQLHTLLHNRLGMVGLNLWRHVRREGALHINVKEQEFRRGGDGEMYPHDVDASRVFATLPGYEILDPAAPHLSAALERCLERIRRYNYGEGWQAAIDGLGDEDRRVAAETLSRSVKTVVDTIAEIEKLRRFAERVTINTLRAWGVHEGCPVPFNYVHEGTHITFGRSDSRIAQVPLPRDLQNQIGQIEFWTGLEPRRRE